MAVAKVMKKDTDKVGGLWLWRGAGGAYTRGGAMEGRRGDLH